MGNELMMDNEIWTFSVESILAKFVRKKSQTNHAALLFCEISDALVFLENMEGHGGLGRQVSRIDLQV